MGIVDYVFIISSVLLLLLAVGLIWVLVMASKFERMREMEEEGLRKLWEESKSERKSIEPYEAFENWLMANGYADLANCKTEDINLDRLDRAIDEYSKS